MHLLTELRMFFIIDFINNLHLCVVTYLLTLITLQRFVSVCLKIKNKC